jgi:protein-arginine kinase activator protein McsA
MQIEEYKNEQCEKCHTTLFVSENMFCDPCRQKLEQIVSDAFKRRKESLDDFVWRMRT